MSRCNIYDDSRAKNNNCIMQLHMVNTFIYWREGDFFSEQLNFRKYHSTFSLDQTLTNNNKKNSKKRECLWKFLYFKFARLIHELIGILMRSRSCHIFISSGDETVLVSSSLFSRFLLVHSIPLTFGVSQISVARDIFK